MTDKLAKMLDLELNTIQLALNCLRIELLEEDECNMLDRVMALHNAVEDENPLCVVRCFR